MATITDKSTEQVVVSKFLKSTQPIWPNLTKRETPLSYMCRQYFKKQREFQLKTIRQMNFKKQFECEFNRHED